MTAYNHLDVRLRMRLPALTENSYIAEFIQDVNNAKQNWFDMYKPYSSSRQQDYRPDRQQKPLYPPHNFKKEDKYKLNLQLWKPGKCTRTEEEHAYHIDDDVDLDDENDSDEPVFAGLTTVSEETAPESPATAMKHGHNVAFAAPTPANSSSHTSAAFATTSSTQRLHQRLIQIRWPSMPHLHGRICVRQRSAPAPSTGSLTWEPFTTSSTTTATSLG